MSHLPDLKTLDSDGAIREMAERSGGDTRRSFLVKAGVGGVAAGAAIGGIGAFALAQGDDNLDDLEILQFALVLEYLEAAFYVEAVDKGDFGGDVGTFAKTVRDHETEHVKVLKSTLEAAGATPVGEPDFNFKDTTSDEKMFLETSLALENTGVGAYLGAAPSIVNPEYLMAAGSILVVEARHAAWAQTLAGGNDLPAPMAFEDPKTPEEVLKIVGDTGFVTSALPDAVLNAPKTADPSTAG